MDSFLAYYKSRKSNLKGLTGVEETISNAEDLEEPIRPRSLRWNLQKSEYAIDREVELL